MTAKSKPAPQIDMDTFTSVATREYDRQREHFQAVLDQLAKDAREAAEVMNRDDLRNQLEKLVQNPVARNTAKDVMIGLYVKERVAASMAQAEVDALKHAAGADRRAAEKLNELAEADAELDEALVKEVNTYGLRSCLRSSAFMAELPGRNAAAIHARRIIKVILGGGELREVLRDEFSQIFDAVARYPSAVRFSGTGPSASALGAYGDAAGASEFIRAMAGCYAADFTMAIPLAYMR